MTVTNAPKRMVGSESLGGTDAEKLDASVLDFWHWAFSDLCANNLRGVFAEWLVATLLGIVPPVREFWAEYDLRTTEGVRVEVKSAAYVQTWMKEGDPPTRISFGGLRSTTWSVETGHATEPSYNSDLYVFTLQVEKSRERWNAMDLAQWRFYIVPRETLARYGARTISLATMRGSAEEVNAAHLTAREFKKRAEQMIAEISYGSAAHRNG